MAEHMTIEEALTAKGWCVYQDGTQNGWKLTNPEGTLINYYRTRREGWLMAQLNQIHRNLYGSPSPPLLDPEWEQERPIIEAVEAEHNPEYLSDDECLALRTLPPG